jgi:hypothetical protein
VLSTSEGAKMDNGVEIRKKRVFPRAGEEREKNKRWRGIYLVCVWCLFYVYENLGQKNTFAAMVVVVDVPPLRSQLLCIWEKRRKSCNISRQLSSLLFGEEFLHVRKMCAILRFNLKYKSNIFCEKVF